MHGLYLLWWVQEKHVSPAFVAAILAAGDIALIALELPTGWFADRFGHRVSLILGSAIQAIAMILCWLGDGAAGVLAASLCVALGDAFRSGAHEALLYRTCRVLDREPEFQRIAARTNAMTLTELVALTIAGGVVVTHFGFVVGWIAEALLSLAGLVMALAMREPPALDEPDLREDAHPSQGWPLYRTLFGLMMPAALLAGAAGAASFLVQTSATFATETVTIFVALITLTEAAGSAVATRMQGAGMRTQALLTLLGALLLCAGLIESTLLPATAVLLPLLLGMAEPIRTAAVQRHAPEDARARVASFANLVTMAVTAIALPLAGIFRMKRRS